MNYAELRFHIKVEGGIAVARAWGEHRGKKGEERSVNR